MYKTWQWLGIFLGLAALSGMLYVSIRYFFQLIKEKRYSIRPLFRGFNQKMWMTTGLGLIFFSLYLFLILSSSFLLDSQWSAYLFSLSYQYPTEFIYLGLFIFAFISLCIYLVRMLIKYLYMKYGKGNS